MNRCRMPKAIAMLFLAVFTHSSIAASAETSYAGIWQDKEKSSHYFVIQENGDRLVLIALPGVEQSGDTLQFSYMGNKQDFVMSRIAPGAPGNDIYNQLKIEFASPDEGHIYPICEACGVQMVNIQKVF